MLKNYLRTTLRYFTTNKGYSFLNVFGLAIGIACAGLIILWVEDEVRFDSNYIKKDRLYVAKVNAKVDAGVFTHSSTPGPFASALKSQMPGIANTCRMSESDAPVLFRTGDKAIYANGRYCEPAVFGMFTLPFVQGNAQTAFAQVYSLVVTEKMARKFFGDNVHVIGKTIRADNKQDYVISAVIKDLPANSTLQFDWLAPFSIYEQQNPWLKNWFNFGITTYIELTPGTNVAAINQQLSDPLYDFTLGKKDVAPSSTHIYLFGMKDWRLYDDFVNGKPTGGGRIQYVHLFTTIAWIILLIACINFMNLATARSEKRSREVGVRKVLGASKGNLVRQFIGEAMLMALLSMFCAILFMSLILPAFNGLIQKELTLGLGNSRHWTVLLGLTLVCGLVAGSYPSLYLSSFRPVVVLKGAKVKGSGAAFIRKGLVVLQFTASIVLVISTIIIYQQIQHVKDRDLGFQKDNLIQLALHGDMQKNFGALRRELINTGSVENAALADHQTLSDGNNTSAIDWPGKDPNSNIIISNRLVSPEYISTLGMRIKEGRDLQSTDEIKMTRQGGPDSAQLYHVLVTESMEALLGKGSAIGKSMEFHSNFGNLHLQVEGVVRDYVYGDVYGKQAPPVIFYYIPQATNLIYIRTSSRIKPEATLANIEQVVKKFSPGYPFEFSFVDDQFNSKFRSEMLISRLSRVFATLAILISCLGLFGLAAHMAERRTKEIGIRKVLGASPSGIAGLLSRDFLQLVLIAILIASPTAYYFMHQWLQSFAYRIQIHWWVFPLAGLSAVLISIMTVSFQAIKAALVNPVHSLRTE